MQQTDRLAGGQITIRGRALRDDSWQQVKELVDRALDLPEEERPAFLDEACGADDRLRQRVQSFLEEPLLAGAGDAPDAERRIGPYRIDKKLGAGGMGEVYKAYDERLERSVAIKLIRSQALDVETAAERFRREAKAAAKLNHPAVVQIYDVLRWRGRDCIVMELVEGRPLTALLKTGPLELEQALDLAQQIAEGLAAAHAAGIVHRDLKTGNVMVTPVGRAKILDFGLAKQLAHSQTPLSVSGAIFGTLETMSPEQAHGEDVDHRSDLFSFGVLLYRMVTGISPFRGETVRETLSKVCAYRQPAARQVNPQVPKSLSELIDRLLKKDPKHRPQTAEEVARDLGRLELTATADASPEEAPTLSDGSTERHLVPEADQPATSPDVEPPSGWDDQKTASESPSSGTPELPPQAPGRRRGRWMIAAAGVVITAALVYWGLPILRFQLAQSQNEDGLSRQALATLDKLRWLPQPKKVDARAELLAARAHYRLGEYRKSQDRAAQAAAKGHSQGMDELVAEAFKVQGGALQHLGDHDQAVAILQKARLAYEALKDQTGIATVLDLMAYSVLAQGELGGASDLFEELLKIYRDLGERRMEASVLGTLGDILGQQEKMQDAEAHLQESLEIFQQLKAEDAIATTTQHLGILKHRQGNLDEAESFYRDAQRRYIELGDTFGKAICDTSLGEVSYLRGDLDTALELYKEALKGHHQSHDSSWVAYTTFHRGRVFAAQGDPAAAREDYQQALDQQIALGEAGTAAETQIELAKLELSEGKAREARIQARAAEQVLRTRQQKAGATLAQTVLIQAHVALGDLTAAQEIAEGVQNYVAEGQYRGVKLASIIALARLRTATDGPGGADVALTELEDATLEASEYKFAEYVLEARLATREIEFSIGRPVGRQLDALVEDAREKGFRQIERRAEAVGR